MKTLLYPKVYAVYLGPRPEVWHHTYTAHDMVHVFRVECGPDAGREFVLDKYPNRSGSTPRRYRTAYYDIVRAYKKVAEREAAVQAHQQTIVLKLYYRNGRWYYRHLGQ